MVIWLEQYLCNLSIILANCTIFVYVLGSNGSHARALITVPLSVMCHSTIQATSCDSNHSNQVAIRSHVLVLSLHLQVLRVIAAIISCGIIFANWKIFVMSSVAIASHARAYYRKLENFRHVLGGHRLSCQCIFIDAGPSDVSEHPSSQNHVLRLILNFMCHSDLIFGSVVASVSPYIS